MITYIFTLTMLGTLPFLLAMLTHNCTCFGLKGRKYIKTAWSYIRRKSVFCFYSTLRKVIKTTTNIQSKVKINKYMHI